ncbi:MAG: IPTL-CTERM sorting domain-containing protein [Acidobacteriota bacterium]
MTRNWRRLVVAIGCTGVLSIGSTALAQTFDPAKSFAVVGGQSVTAASGGIQTQITGDVGVAPGTSLTGFPAFAATVPPFATHNNDGLAQNAQATTQALYDSITPLPPGTAIGDELSNQILGPGTYSIGAANIASPGGPVNGTLTLNGAGTYIFKVASSLTANVNTSVNLIGVDPCLVYWQVGSAATLNGVTFSGNVVAQAAVTLGSNATLAGRALTTSLGSVTLAGSNTVGGCSVAVVPTMPQWLLIALAGLLALGGMSAMRRRAVSIRR